MREKNNRRIISLAKMEVMKMEKRIEALKTRIESIQNDWRKNPNYNGCMAEDVRGMIDALDIITEKTWKFNKDGKLVDC